MKLIRIYLLALLCPFYTCVEAQQIQTKALTKIPFPATEASSLQKAERDPVKNGLPYFSHYYVLTNQNIPGFKIKNSVIKELNSKEVEEIKACKKFIGSDFSTQTSLSKSGQDYIVHKKINSIRLNPSTNNYEYLESYEVEWDLQHPEAINQNAFKRNAQSSAANTSVLASGKWYKIGLTKEGVYKLDKTFLKNLGISVSSINPQHIRIYGNGGKPLPNENFVFRNDDLVENSIIVHGENDGVFHDTDYVLLYGQSTDKWKRSAGTGMLYEHQNNHFSDTSFYFITTDLGAGKRIQTQASLNNTPNYTSGTYDYYGLHEENLKNLLKSGNEFYGEKFDFTNSYTFAFNVPSAVTGDSIYVKTNLAARCADTNYYQTSFGNTSFTVKYNPLDINYYLADAGVEGEQAKGGILTSSNITVTVSKLTANATGWLNYIWMNCRRNLVFSQSSFNYRDHRSVGGPNTFTEYLITNSNADLPFIWDVTNPLQPSSQQYTTLNTQLSYVATADSLKEFCIFTLAQTLTPKAYGPIPNQDLHAIQQADFIIVTHPLFFDEALRIGKLHQQYDSLSYVVATTEQVYNEFSSGTPDIGAIRDFVKMLYKRPTDPTKATKYLLLFGDGSYKNKEISSPSNSALIPCYQTPNSLSQTASMVVDDYFALMDDNEGTVVMNNLIDIGVGRFPVRTKAEAKSIVNKIEHYYKLNYNFNVNAIESSCTTAENDYPQGDWRNWVCFLADDEDSNGHLNEANYIAGKVYNNIKQYNVDKIFIDSYVQYSTPGGDRYPDAVTDINKRVEKGALVFNYTGHGGELGLTEERIVEVPQILNWKNKNNLPLFVTATCEFTRFDDPDRTSAGEYCLLNENGGAIGLLTTTRVAYSHYNFTLNTALYDHVLSPMTNGQMPHLGDIVRLTKRQLFPNELYGNFMLLGDPALKLAYPQYKITTATINSQNVSPSSSDTLRALSKITVTGFIADKNGNKLTTFNGVVYPTVFDKENIVTTLGNDAGSSPVSFAMKKNIIYKGKSEVKNGDFSFSFLVPKDISYTYGTGKISYYAHNGVNDASGYYEKVIIGGSNPNAMPDNSGPAVSLYMNDEKFVPGGTTNENPKLYATITDSSGINTIGTGIGHDAVAILDENTGKPIVLNDYYVADLNTYQSGKIRYPFNELSEGTHRLSLKIWDVQNNSSTSYTDFIVAKEAELALSHILNYPNPFTTKTKFFIEHNQCCTNLKVLIQIYTVSGKVVKSINQTINNDGFRFDGIEWDGKDEFGDKLARGVYVYRISVTDGDSKKAEKIEKLVILN